MCKTYAVTPLSQQEIDNAVSTSLQGIPSKNTIYFFSAEVFISGMGTLLDWLLPGNCTRYLYTHGTTSSVKSVATAGISIKQDPEILTGNATRTEKG